MDAIIYHNPECGTSRTKLATIVRLCRRSELVLDLLPTPQHPG
ncbi:hypothetical protein QWJ07_18195 [Frankia sp. RB7]|nr:hypothetical protein [Frankia sp. RB7]